MAGAYSDHDLVFAREDGNPLSPEQVTKVFGRLVRSSGVRRLSLHGLRHCRASLLLASGSDTSLGSKVLGHSSIVITSNTYQHLYANAGRQAAEAADALIPPIDDQRMIKGAHLTAQELPRAPQTPVRLVGPVESHLMVDDSCSGDS